MSTIRIGTNRDYDEVAAFALEVLAEMGQTSTPEQVIRSFEQHMLDVDGLWLVARGRDGAVVGTLMAQIRGGGLVERRDAFIDSVAVRPAARSSRVAGELILHAETWARFLGARKLVLGLPSSSPMAPPLRHGYEVEETWYSKELSR